MLDESTRRLVAIEEDQEHLNYPEDRIDGEQMIFEWKNSRAWIGGKLVRHP